MTPILFNRSLLGAAGLSLGLVQAALAMTSVSGPTGLTSVSPAAPAPTGDSASLHASIEAIVPPALNAALNKAVECDPYPVGRRRELLELLLGGNQCYSRVMSQAQWEQAIGHFNLLPPGQFEGGFGQRFFSQTTVWVGNGNAVASSSGRAVPANLTLSFPGDGTDWGGVPNELGARLGDIFGPTAKDRGFEYIRQSYACWSRFSGLRFTEVGDDNSPRSAGTTRVATRGDLRVGSVPVDGASGILAFNAFPSGGGDMTIDAGDFASNYSAATNNYRFFRNVIAHEHGHGNGSIHTVPCNETKLMEPFASSAFDMLQIDEVRGSQRNYGDRFAGNNSAANATDFGNLTTPVLRSVIEKSLSTNGTAGFNNSDEDWFKFTIDSAQNVTISVDPIGGSYINGQQANGCDGPTNTVNADQAGNLNLQLRNAAGTTVLQGSTTGAAGITETINAANLAPGTYTVRVFDVGPNGQINQTLQLYDLTVRVGTAKAPPTAIAGINKRISAGQICFFMGNINSYSNDLGSIITTYAWDLDGDGVFEIPNTAQPTRIYSTFGTTNVTLRVTDNFGLTDTHTIQVVVANCPCDWNSDAFLNSQDFFDFLAAFFSNNADFNNDGLTNSQDFFDFLGCFFAGC